MRQATPARPGHDVVPHHAGRLPRQCADMAKAKKKPNKASSLKRSKTAEKASAAFPFKHDKKAGKSTAAESTTPSQASQATTSQGLAAAKIIGFTNLGNTCFFNSVLQVGRLCLSCAIWLVGISRLIISISGCSRLVMLQTDLLSYRS